MRAEIAGVYVHCHQRASGIRISEYRAIGRSRGGATTKIHLYCDADGYPLNFKITGSDVNDSQVAGEMIEMIEMIGKADYFIAFVLSNGTTHDVKVAPNLIDKIDLITTEILCADNGYDSDALRKRIKQAGYFNNIPRKQNTKFTNNHVNWCLYKARHLLENPFAKLKNYRAVATRFDTLKQSCENTMALACADLWLKL